MDRILNDAKKAVRAMIDEHRHVVEGRRDALLERDELLGDEILAVIEKALEPPAAVDLTDAPALEVETS